MFRTQAILLVNSSVFQKLQLMGGVFLSVLDAKGSENTCGPIFHTDLQEDAMNGFP